MIWIFWSASSRWLIILVSRNLPYFFGKISFVNNEQRNTNKWMKFRNMTSLFVKQAKHFYWFFLFHQEKTLTLHREKLHKQIFTHGICGLRNFRVCLPRIDWHCIRTTVPRWHKLAQTGDTGILTGKSNLSKNLSHKPICFTHISDPPYIYIYWMYLVKKCKQILLQRTNKYLHYIIILFSCWLISFCLLELTVQRNSPQTSCQ